MKNYYGLLLAILLFSGCATASEALGFKHLNVPPEFNQKIILEVSDDYNLHQATRSGYDAGDLQSFHTQHTLPLVVEDAFKEMFGQVEMSQRVEGIEMGAPDVPAVFEVKLIDIANDIYNESDSYRGEVTIAAAMKSPDGTVMWHQAFRGQGYIQVDPQFSTGLGPQDAVVDAIRDALSQMQDAIVSSPQVRLQMQHYQSIAKARSEATQDAN